MDAGTTGIWIPLVVILVMAFGWGCTVTTLLVWVRRDCAKLIWMHENADDAGFGTVALRAAHERDQAILLSALRDNTRAMFEVSHYIQWSIESTTGTKPPPPKPAVMNDA